MNLAISREALKRKIMEDDYDGPVGAGGGTVPAADDAQWYHTEDRQGPTLAQASLGRFFNAVLTEGGKIGSVHVFDRSFDRSPVGVTVFMTGQMKDAIEARTNFRFRLPPDAPAYRDPA